MTAVAFHDVTLQQGGDQILDGISLEIGDGEIVAVVGPSGSGKTTLLRLIAGLETPTTGVVTVGDRPTGGGVTSGIAMVNEVPGLYGHLDVEGNLGFPLMIRGDDRAEARAAAGSQAKELSIRSLFGRKPSQLSDGQQGLVATGRALIRPEVEVLLLDELLSNADRLLRERVRGIIRDLHLRRGPTVILATNDPNEAHALADRVAVIANGSVLQFDTPMTVYRDPVSLEAADLISSYPINRFDGVLQSGDPAHVRVAGSQLVIPRRLDDSYDQVSLSVGIRPEDLTLREGSERAILEAYVESIRPLGHRFEVHFRVQGDERLHLALIDAEPPDTDSLWLAVSHFLLFSSDGSRFRA